MVLLQRRRPPCVTPVWRRGRHGQKPQESTTVSRGRLTSWQNPQDSTGVSRGRLVPVQNPQDSTPVSQGRLMPGQKPQDSTGVSRGRLMPGQKPQDSTPVVGLWCRLGAWQVYSGAVALWVYTKNMLHTVCPRSLVHFYTKSFFLKEGFLDILSFNSSGSSLSFTVSGSVFTVVKICIYINIHKNIQIFKQCSSKTAL